jgi:hypothetical protein
MAAGAIPPPLFFEQRRLWEHFGGSILASVHGILKNGLRQNTLENTTSWKTPPASITQFERPARSSPTTRAMTAEG